MKREIKFRGKSKETNQWIYGDYQSNPCANITFINSDDELDCFEVFEETVGQFTGLKDNDNVDIYEWDIVENGYSGIWIIQPLEYGAMSLLGVCEKYKGYNYDISALNASVEVIGNVYDNPELIK